jgi:YaiO family outer membrane protein
MNYQKLIIVVFFILLSLNSFSQIADSISADNGYQMARNMAFNGKKEEAKVLCKKLILKSPNYTDISILLGRLYVWTDEYDSARAVFNSILLKKPNEDSFIAYSDLERWDDKPLKSLDIVNKGLVLYPNSEDLLLRKAKAKNDIGETKIAYQILDSILINNPKNNEARALAERLKSNSFKNKISLSYSLDYFDKQYSAPSNKWHLASLSYSRSLKYLGSTIARLNYGERFGSEGYQFEVDMYPSISKKMYAYLNAGVSSYSIFPKTRYGISLYRSFPHAFEGEIGLRYLKFNTSTLIYTASIGKYVSNFWFSLRGFFVKSDFSETTYSQSYSLISRYYLSNADNYIALTLGYGISPDDRTQQSLLENPQLSSRKIFSNYQNKFKKSYIFNIGAGLINQNYFQGQLANGNDFNFTIGIEKKF